MEESFSQQELLSNNPNTKFNNDLEDSLNKVLKSIDVNQKNGDNASEDYKKLFILHRIDFEQYHKMRRAFRDNNTYNVWVLSKNRVTQMFTELEENYNPNNDSQKYLMISFDDSDKNKAKFRIQAVWGHSFGNYVSCYSEKLITKLLEHYNKVKIVKSRDLLLKESGEHEQIGSGNYARKYEGKFHLACIQCEGIKDNSDDNPFRNELQENEFFDVVHDPDKPGGGGN